MNKIKTYILTIVSIFALLFTLTSITNGCLPADSNPLFPPVNDTLTYSALYGRNKDYTNDKTSWSEYKVTRSNVEYVIISSNGGLITFCPVKDSLQQEFYRKILCQ